MTWIAFHAASLFGLVRAMPKPEPALTDMLPASRTGTGATPTLKDDLRFTLMSCQGPSTYMAADPAVSLPLARFDDGVPEAGNSGATFSSATSLV